MKALWLIGLILTLPLAASARLGETLQEVEARYGKPLQIQGDSRAYRFAGMIVLVSFVDGHSGQEIFKKTAPEKFSDAEVATILEANGQGKAWKFVDQADAKLWILEGQTVFAYSKKFQPEVFVGDRAANEALVQQQAERDKAKLKGL